MTDAFNDKTIDLVGLSPDKLWVNLYIIQSGKWTASEEQLCSLQEKIHNYVGFALDGQMTRSYPDTIGLLWRIVIECQTGHPDPATTEFLARLAERVRQYGGDLTIHVSEAPPGSP